MIQVDKHDKHLDGVDGDADVLDKARGWARGINETNLETNVLSQELEQTKKKKAVLVSVKLVKRKLLKRI